MRLSDDLQVATPSPRVKKLSGRLGNGNGHHRRRPHIKHGWRLAARRAFTGANLIREKGYSLDAALDASGSCHVYVRAMQTILASEDQALLMAVLTDRVSVMTAAAQVRALGKLLAAYAVATAETKAAFGRAVGIDDVFDNVVAPTITVAAE
jgi:hypothetical protein